MQAVVGDGQATGVLFNFERAGCPWYRAARRQLPLFAARDNRQCSFLHENALHLQQMKEAREVHVMLANRSV